MSIRLAGDMYVTRRSIGAVRYTIRIRMSASGRAHAGSRRAARDTCRDVEGACPGATARALLGRYKQLKARVVGCMHAHRSRMRSCRSVVTKWERRRVPSRLYRGVRRLNRGVRRLNRLYNRREHWRWSGRRPWGGLG